MGWLLLITSLAYAVVSTFGAWTVARRRRALAFTFMASAALLTVGGVAAAYRVHESWVLLAAGSVIASAASLWTARRVLGRVVARNHLARAVLGVALTGIAAVFLR
ncbi:MAG: hypothetical protein U5J97_04770 [Trueperaceae bacterium]|nr:hypothetical protein [Trueperaceae bacterium]